MSETTTAVSQSPTDDYFAPVIENPGSLGRIVLVCEHASNHIPANWGDLGLTAGQRKAHIAWDPGALAVARSLSALLDAVLIHAPASRLERGLGRDYTDVGQLVRAVPP